jgi:multicomponent Na+:H+ antiporter subunit D
VIAENLPALQVVVPLLGAPACSLLRGARVSWAFTLAISWAAFAMSWLLLQQVLRHGAISYALGGWAAPYGIEYRIDAVNGFVLLIVSGIAAVVVPYARTSVAAEFEPHRIHQFYAAFLLCLAGLLGVTITGDAFNLFVFLEISSLSSYVLVGLGRDRRALTASYQYLVMGTIGATFIVIGIGLLYAATGTLNMADLASRIGEVGITRTIGTAFTFIVVGVSLKLALFPLHLWLPNAYTFAPSVVSAFLAATATKVAVYVLLRFLFTIFAATLSFRETLLDEVIIALALIAMFVCSIVAVFQDNLKRMLAYSSLGQIGYMVLGIALADVNGLTASILHLFNHAITKGGMFLALGCAAYRIGSVRIEALAGLGRRMPWTAAAFVVGGFGLIGVPGTAGFVSKWYLATAALGSGRWPLAVLILGSSLIAVIYVWRVVEAMYFRPAPSSAPPAREAPLSLLIPTLVLIGASIAFGLAPGFPAGVAHLGALSLITGAR